MTSVAAPHPGASSPADLEAFLQEKIATFHQDPLGFVNYAYPWGEAGTKLAEETGPDEWQVKILSDIGHALKHGWVMNNGVKIDCTSGIFLAVSSGHGIGKSALMAMLDQWFMSTRVDPQIVTTANTKEQLTSKTGREMSKWHKLLINRHWFEKTATKFACLADPDTWFSSLIPWSENNPEAFAGTHEKNVMLKMDEASAIPGIIWETSEGAMTESNGVKIWIVFGNPTQNTGRFKECFGKHRNFWITYQIDARTSKRTDKSLFEKWIQMYGEDSDFVRIRIKGTFPRAGACQFIPNDIVENAMGKIYPPSTYVGMKRSLSIDIARYGDDTTVMGRKQGLVVYGIKRYKGLGTLQCAGLIAEEIIAFDPDVTYLDMGNTGAAIYDILISWGYSITEIWYGAEAEDKKTYFNKRVEMWGRMRDAIKNGLAIPDDNDLHDDLIGPEYGFSSKEQYQLESKADMKSRGLPSPDAGDMVAQFYSYPLAENAKRDKHVRQGQTVTDYNILEQNAPVAPVQTITEYSMFD